MGPAPAIGIDLGTTFSLAAVYRKGRTEIIPNKEGNHLTPSYIYFDPNSLDVSVGTTAYHKGRKNFNNFLFDVKRLIGRKYDDVYVQELKKKSNEYKFNIVRGEEDKAEIELMHDREKVCKSPEQASSEILKYLRESACEYLRADVTEAVISVPAHFSNAQRKGTRAAAELAGFKVLKLITEPVAAAIHFAEDRLQTQGPLLVFDFGGGTLDVSIIQVDDKTFRVKSVEGDTFLGGRNFDQILLTYFESAMIREFGMEIFNDRLYRRVNEECTELKIKLSTEQNYNISIYCIGGIEERSFDLSLSRLDFENLTKDLFDRALSLVKTCLREAGMSQTDITEVVLVGGTTKIPKVRKMLGSYFDDKKIRTDVNPYEAVALGAAIQAALLKEKFVELEKYEITEITPLSLGIGFDGDLMEVAIRKSTPLPFKSAPINAITMANDQKSTKFRIYEGERKNCKFNNLLGSFTLDELPPRKSGEVKFEIIFSLNEDGILEVTGTEKCTGKNNNLVVTIGEFRLCDHKIRRTIEDAEKNKKEDDLFEKFVVYKWKVRKTCNHILYDMHKISSDVDRKFVEEKCEQMKDTLEKLEYTQITKLQCDYKSFKKSIKGILDNNIDVNLSDDEDSFGSSIHSMVRAMRSNLFISSSNSLASATKNN